MRFDCSNCSNCTARRSSPAHGERSSLRDVRAKNRSQGGPSVRAKNGASQVAGEPNTALMGVDKIALYLFVEYGLRRALLK